MMKKVVSFVLAVCLSMSLAVPAFATSDTSLTDSAVISAVDGKTSFGDVAEPLAETVPTSHRSLNRAYTAELIDLAATKSSLTRYYFSTQTSEINLEFDLERSGTSTIESRKLTVYLYEKKSGSSSWKRVDSFEVSWSEKSHTADGQFSDLKSDSFYYIKFTNDSSTTSKSRADISGTITITQ